MNHRCQHHDSDHQCHCGMGRDHTLEEFLVFLKHKALSPLDSEGL